MAFWEEAKYLGKMMNKKKEVTNWAKARKLKNTNWHQNLSQKSSKKPCFRSVKNGASKGGTVSNSWSSTETNSWKAKMSYQN